MSNVNETRFLGQNESCECKCRLNESACNSRQKWNHDECWCESKELDDRCSCKNGYMWKPSTFDCECNEACKIDEYSDIKNRSCKKRVIGKLVLACESETLNAITTSLDDKRVTCEESNCIIYTIL